MEWPKESFECTRIVKGGLVKSKPGTVRAILCKPGHVSSNPALARLSQTLPALKALNEKNLPAGKIATVRCGGVVEIDGAACPRRTGRIQL